MLSLSFSSSFSNGSWGDLTWSATLQLSSLSILSWSGETGSSSIITPVLVLKEGESGAGDEGAGDGVDGVVDDDDVEIGTVNGVVSGFFFLCMIVMGILLFSEEDDPFGEMIAVLRVLGLAVAAEVDDDLDDVAPMLGWVVDVGADEDDPDNEDWWLFESFCDCVWDFDEDFSEDDDDDDKEEEEADEGSFLLEDVCCVFGCICVCGVVVVVVAVTW